MFSLVLNTLEEALAEEPGRKCFRLIGGVLVERTVQDVVPALQTNREGVSIIQNMPVLWLTWISDTQSDRDIGRAVQVERRRFRHVQARL